MFNTETRTQTYSVTREFGCATCDRCGHVMDEADHRGGYNNLTLLRFRAGHGSRFGDGNYVEGDFCDACLFELLARYVRVIDDEQVPDSCDFFHVPSPRRLYAEHQVADAMAEGVLMTLKGWIEQCFDPKFTRRPAIACRAPATDSTGASGAATPDE